MQKQEIVKFITESFFSKDREVSTGILKADSDFRHDTIWFHVTDIEGFQEEFHKEENQVILKKWVEDLKKGSYKQGQNLMYSSDDDKYCCVGVLYHGQGVEPIVMDDMCVPREAIREKVPFMVPLQAESNIFFYELNDELLLSFEEIAQVIEKFLIKK